MPTYDLSCMPCCGGLCCNIVPDGDLCVSITNLSGCSCLDLLDAHISNLGQPSGTWVGTLETDFCSESQIEITFTWDGSVCAGSVEIVSSGGSTTSAVFGEDEISCTEDGLTLISINLDISVGGVCTGTVNLDITNGVC